MTADTTAGPVATPEEMTGQPGTRAVTAFEYRTIRVALTHQPLYEDTYRGLGWTVDPRSASSPGRSSLPALRGRTVELRLRRDRGVRNRGLLEELERAAAQRLSRIVRLDRSAAGRALTVALTVGLVGAALLAGSVFSLEAGMLVLSIALGAAGLFAWLAGWGAYRIVASRRAAEVAPLVEEEHDALFETAVQAARLLT